MLPTALNKSVDVNHGQKLFVVFIKRYKLWSQTVSSDLIDHLHRLEIWIGLHQQQLV
jgi:hypothetical protein